MHEDCIIYLFRFIEIKQKNILIQNQTLETPNPKELDMGPNFTDAKDIGPSQGLIKKNKIQI